MAASIARRSISVRNLWRTTSPTTFSVRSNPIFQQSRISPSPFPTSSSSLRRQALYLSSLLPVHSAVAAARLVSKLPETNISSEGRFVNYLSPI